MTKISLLTLLFTLITFHVGVVPGQDSSGQLSRDFTVSPGQQLTFDLQTGGSISVKGWDNNVVSVKADFGGRDASKVKLDMNQAASGIEITSAYTGSRSSYNTGVHLEVMVPRQFNLQIDSAGGSITLDGIEGNINGETGGGHIQIENSKGNVSLSTGGGHISVKNSALDGTVTTGGGHVTIESNTGNLKGSTGGGRVEYKN